MLLCISYLDKDVYLKAIVVNKQKLYIIEIAESYQNNKSFLF